MRGQVTARRRQVTPWRRSRRMAQVTSVMTVKVTPMTSLTWAPSTSRAIDGWRGSAPGSCPRAQPPRRPWSDTRGCRDSAADTWCSSGGGTGWPRLPPGCPGRCPWGRRWTPT
ncbi:uncharacterized protein RBU47_010059 [Passerculus sandwichensis]